MKLPYPIFLFLLKEIYLQEMMRIPEGREQLERIERLKVTQPDFDKLKQLPGYSTREGGE